MKYSIMENVSQKKLDTDIFLLDRTNSVFHTFNETGSFIWNGLKEKKDINTIKSELCEQFDIAPEEASKDIIAFINECENKNLLKIDPE